MTQATTWSVPLVGPATPTVMAQRTDDSFDALLSGHSGSSRPAYAVAGTTWEDTSVANKVRIYFYDGSQDILLAAIDTTNDRVELAPQPVVDIASATTTDIGAVTSQNVRITGTTTITGLGTVAAGTFRRVRFAAALTLTYNATSLILPGAASVTTAAGDVAEFVSEGSGNWRCVDYTQVARNPKFPMFLPVVNATGAPPIDFPIPPGATEVTINFMGVSTDSGAGSVIIRLGTGGSPDTTGYLGSVGRVSNAILFSAGSGFYDDTSNAANVRHGKVVLTLADPSTNTWTASFHLGLSDTADIRDGGGSKSLSGTLDIVRLTLTSGNFDAGKIGVVCR